MRGRGGRGGGEERIRGGKRGVKVKDREVGKTGKRMGGRREPVKG